MMSFNAFSFFYYFVFFWGGVGMLFIAVAVIREMFQLRQKADAMEARLSEKKERNEIKKLVKGSEKII